MLEIEKFVLEMNVFDGLISRFDMTKERIYELEGMLIETFKMKKQRKKKRLEKKNKISQNCGTTTKGVTYV